MQKKHSGKMGAIALPVALIAAADRAVDDLRVRIVLFRVRRNFLVTEDDLGIPYLRRVQRKRRRHTAADIPAEHRQFVILFKFFKLKLTPVRNGNIIGIHFGYQIILAAGKPFIKCKPCSYILRQTNRSNYFRKSFFVFLQYFFQIFGKRTVADNHKIVCFHRLIQHTLNCLCEKLGFFFCIYRHQNGVFQRHFAPSLLSTTLTVFSMQ